MVEFSSNGNLTYSIREAGRVQKMLLTFSVVDDVIRTDQPSQPRVETKYRITEDERIELNYNGEITTYVRAQLMASSSPLGPPDPRPDVHRSVGRPNRRLMQMRPARSDGVGYM